MEPQGVTDEKRSFSQNVGEGNMEPPPPSYPQAVPQSGSAQNPGFTQPSYGQRPGYAQPAYGQNPAYGQAPAYGQPPGYGPQPGYAYPPPGYGQPAMMGNATVIAQGQPTAVVVRSNAVRESDCLACSILNMIFCNLIFGGIAVAFSCMARDAYDRGDETQGRSHANVAKIMNIIGPILGAIGIICAITFIVMFLGVGFSVGGSYNNDWSCSWCETTTYYYWG